MRALPSPFEKTFFTGQPMLMSTMSKPASLSSAAAFFINSGSQPKSCTARGVHTGSVKSRGSVPLPPKQSPLALTISV